LSSQGTFHLTADVEKIESPAPEGAFHNHVEVVFLLVVHLHGFGLVEP